jgi:carbon-monoxide dehydrogenase small subunit
MLATALLRENPDPTDDEIREAMASNICRCTGYQSILEAVRAAAGGEGGRGASNGPGPREAAAR